MLPGAAIPVTVDRSEVGLWLGAGCHLVHYAVGDPAADEAGLNVVLIGAAGAAPPKSPFGRAARPVIDAVPAWKASQLFDVDPSAAWVKGCVALVGDAAHAMAPSAAQGGAQAIEDAWVLPPNSHARHRFAQRSRAINTSAGHASNGSPASPRAICTLTN